MIAYWQESYDKPRPSVKKQRHHFMTMVPVVKAVVFPVVTYGCESWTVKMSEAKEFWNCGAGEESRESLGKQDQTSPS